MAQSEEEERELAANQLEAHIKDNTPLRPKDFTATVSYLRPATENKKISPERAQRAQRLQSAGTLQGNQVQNRINKRRSLVTGGGNQRVNVNAHLMKSGQTRATNISSNEHSSPDMGVNPALNITNQGLEFADDGKGKDQSQITFQSLQEGDIFDRDIQRIMSIINGVEQQFSEKKVSKDFQNALHNAYQSRKLKLDHDHMVTQTVNQSSASQTRKRGG